MTHITPEVEAQPSSSADVFPTVSFDTRYGQNVDYVDVDLAQITDFLRGRGLSDKQIGDLKIHFGAEPLGKSRTNAPRDGGRTVGLYKTRSQRIDLD